MSYNESKDYEIHCKHAQDKDYRFVQGYKEREDATAAFNNIVGCIGKIGWEGKKFRLLEVTKAFLAEVEL